MEVRRGEFRHFGNEELFTLARYAVKSGSNSDAFENLPICVANRLRQCVVLCDYAWKTACVTQFPESRAV